MSLPVYGSCSFPDFTTQLCVRHLCLTPGQIAVEDIIAGVAAVVVHVGPRLAELSALVPGFRARPLTSNESNTSVADVPAPVPSVGSSAYAEPTGSPMARLAASNPDKTTIIEP